MTGMKEGAGENPFEEDTSDESPTDDEATESSEEPTSSTEPIQTEQEQMSIPYIYRRKNVKEDRERYPLFLQEKTHKSEREVRRELEDEFDDEVKVTDIREALILSGLENLDDVINQLEEWGYGLEME